MKGRKQVEEQELWCGVESEGGDEQRKTGTWEAGQAGQGQASSSCSEAAAAVGGQEQQLRRGKRKQRR